MPSMTVAQHKYLRFTSINSYQSGVVAAMEHRTRNGVEDSSLQASRQTEVYEELPVRWEDCRLWGIYIPT